jgi:hypothetical protein
MPVDIKSGPAGVDAPRDPAHRNGGTVDTTRVPQPHHDDRNLTDKGIAARVLLLGAIEAIEQDLEAVRQEHRPD